MKTIRLLTIGNSFANNALAYLERMVGTTKHFRLQVGRANLGGCSLEKHWNLAVYTNRCPEHKIYTLGPTTDGQIRQANLQDALSAESWDYVCLQQVSHKSWLRETYEPYLGLLYDLVRKLAPQANVVLHQTWAYRSDSPFFPQHGLTQEIMHQRIRDAYAYYSSKLNCNVIPSGDAIQMARNTQERTFIWPERDFDYQHVEAPALPEQKNSLAVGWKWAINTTDDGIPEMRLDANHLNELGCYLTGCVWFTFLTGIDACDLTFCPNEIHPETAVFLRSIAHKTRKIATCCLM